MSQTPFQFGAEITGRSVYCRKESHILHFLLEGLNVRVNNFGKNSLKGEGMPVEKSLPTTICNGSEKKKIKSGSFWCKAQNFAGGKSSAFLEFGCSASGPGLWANTFPQNPANSQDSCMQIPRLPCFSGISGNLQCPSIKLHTFFFPDLSGKNWNFPTI